jgi:hypothetical protein
MSKKSMKERRRARMKASRADERRGEPCQHRTLAAIKEYFESKGLSVFGGPEEGHLGLDITFYPPEAVTYRDDEGDAACSVIVSACEDGQFVTIAAKDAWNLRGCRHRASVYETLVRLTPDLPVVRFQHDPRSDGVTPFTIVKVDNREVSSDLVQEGIAKVIHAIPRWDPVIRRVMETGEVSMPSFPGDGEELSLGEMRRIGQDLADRLAEDEVARWQRLRQDMVAAAGSTGTLTISEELDGDYLMGTAAIFHGGRVLAMTPTLPAKFEKFVNGTNQVTNSVVSALAKMLGL